MHAIAAISWLLLVLATLLVRGVSVDHRQAVAAGVAQGHSPAVDWVSLVARQAVRAPATPVAPALAPAPGGMAGMAGICGCEPPQPDQCHCGASLDYLKCITEVCNDGKCGSCSGSYFKDQCMAISTMCGAELDFACAETSTCQGKFHQDDFDVIGLKLDTASIADDVYCGSSGKCLGQLHIATEIHRGQPGNRLNCLLEDKTSKSSACQVELTGSSAVCTMPMVPDLPVNTKIKGHCWLADDFDGERITKNAWFTLKNNHPLESVAKTRGAQTPMVRPQVTVEDISNTDSNITTVLVVIGILFVLAVALSVFLIQHNRKPL